MKRIVTLVHAWLVLDFFGDARRSGGGSSTLTTTIFTQSFLALVFAALLYPDYPLVPFAAANLSLSTLLLAVGVLGDPEQRNRQLADHALLSTAPLPAAAVVLARALHAAFYVGLLTVGTALPAAILCAWLVHRPLLVPSYLLLACLCSGLATGALAVLLRAARRWLGVARTALLAGSLKALLLALGVVAFALSLRALQADADALPIGRSGALLLPPYHAAKVLWDPLHNLDRLAGLLGAGAVLLLLGVLLGDQSRARAERVGRKDPLMALLLRLVAGGPARGIAAFTATMLWRSPGLRARVLPLLGVPAAMVFLALKDGDPRGRQLFLGIALQFPAIYLPFVIAFLPRADQPGTAWVFEQAPRADVALAQRATFAALCTHVLLPVHALAATAMLLSGVPVLLVATAVSCALGIAVVTARLQVGALRAIPFTEPRENADAADLGGLMLYAVGLSLFGAGFGMLPDTLLRALAAAGTVLVALAVLRRNR
ncbi:MAG TPA: hypothetical protein VK348_16055 [Planctomycetota bacterium]|nr:hypothetical protein [Planctomycetota bacterium]